MEMICHVLCSISFDRIGCGLWNMLVHGKPLSLHYGTLGSERDASQIFSAAVGLAVCLSLAKFICFYEAECNLQAVVSASWSKPNNSHLNESKR